MGLTGRCRFVNVGGMCEAERLNEYVNVLMPGKVYVQQQLEMLRIFRDSLSSLIRSSRSEHCDGTVGCRVATSLA